MGIIAKQSIKGSVYTYVGAVIGFANTVLLMPKLFSTEQVGLVNILVAIAIIYTQIASLGFPNVLSRVFPYFRNNTNGHNGMFALGMAVTLVGFLLTLGIFYVSKNYIVTSNAEKSGLLVENLHFIPQLILFTAFFTFLDSYAKALFDSVSGTALREVYSRILITGSILIFGADLVDFEEFVFIYILAYNSPAVILTLILMWRKQFKFTLPDKKLIAEHKREIIRVALYGIMSGFAGTAIVNIDTYMVTQYLGLSEAGIYAISFYFGTLIGLPARSLRKIGSIVLSEAWKRNDIPEIQKIYEKSTVTQLIIGLYLFLGIWANIDNIFSIIPDYAAGRYVIFFIGLGYVLDMAGGLSAMIMLTSRFYNLFSLLSLINVVFIVVSNMIFIPIFGLKGAAIASGLTLFVFSIIRFLFLNRKFGLQPYSFKHLKIIAFSAIIYLVIYFIPDISNSFIDIFVKGSLISLFFLIFVYNSKVSEDINSGIDALKSKFFKK